MYVGGARPIPFRTAHSLNGERAPHTQRSVSQLDREFLARVTSK